MNKIIMKKLLHAHLGLFPRPFERYFKGDNLIGVEIGIEKGEHAKSMLKHLNIKKLYLIDPYSNKGYDEVLNLEEVEKIAHKKLNGYNEIKWIKAKSADAISDIPNNLDFVYIDGNHHYEFVKEDINNYWKKVKKGGWLAGHDFCNSNCSQHDGVIQAVIEFAVTNKLKLHVDSPDWWIKKRNKQ